MLLEVGVAMTAAAVLLYGAIFFFTSFQRIDRTARERVQTSRALVRLAEQFRGEVHEAREVAAEGGEEADLASGKSLIRLDGAQIGRVEYAVGENRQLVRTITNADKIVEREVFDLGLEIDYSIDVRRVRVTLVTLVVAISRQADAENKPPETQRRITALLSRDGRYEVAMQKNGSQ
jgi:hypothetical protein